MPLDETGIESFADAAGVVHKTDSNDGCSSDRRGAHHGVVLQHSHRGAPNNSISEGRLHETTLWGRQWGGEPNSITVYVIAERHHSVTR